MASGDSPSGFFSGTRCSLRLFAGDRSVYGAFDAVKDFTDSRCRSVDVIGWWTAMVGTHSQPTQPMLLTLANST